MTYLYNSLFFLSSFDLILKFSFCEKCCKTIKSSDAWNSFVGPFEYLLNKFVYDQNIYTLYKHYLLQSIWPWSSLWMTTQSFYKALIQKISKYLNIKLNVLQCFYIVYLQFTEVIRYMYSYFQPSSELYYSWSVFCFQSVFKKYQI